MTFFRNTLCAKLVLLLANMGDDDVLTPNAALLKFQGSAHLTVDQVLRRRLECLTTRGLSLIGVQPEAGDVSLSIAQPHREVVSLQLL